MSRKRKRTHGLRLVKRPESPYYQVCGTLRGITVKKSTGTDREDHAKAFLKKVENDILLQTLHGTDDARETATFARAWNLYIDQNEDRKTRATGLLLSHFRDMPLKQLTDERVIEFARLHYPKAKPSSVNRLVYTPLIALMHLGAKNKLCDPPNLTRPIVKKRMVEHAPPEWMSGFIARCDNPRLSALVRVLTTTGCRVAEACRIRWQDIEWSTREIVLGHTKNGDPRVITITSGLADVVRALRQPDDVAGKRVFGYADKSSVNHALKRQAARLGVRYYSSHKLGRHAFAARLLARGHNLGEVAAAGGWSRSSLRMMYETYAHLEKSKLTGAVLAAAEDMEGA